MQRSRGIFCSFCLMVFIGMVSIGPLNAEPLAQKYSKILHFEEGEDATSIYYFIYLFDNKGKLSRLLTVWSGGCCKKPTVDEFSISGNIYKFQTIYRIANNPKNLVKAILCGRVKKILPEKPGASFDISGVGEVVENIGEAKPFAGCK